MIETPSSPYYSPFVGGGHDYSVNPNAIPNIPILITAFLAILATGGPTYSFGVYATTLKENLNLTQSELETLGAASFAAGFISWIPGLCVDLWGSQKALIIGGLGQCFGFSLYWTVSRFAYQVLPQASWVPILSFLSMLIFTSNNLVIGGVFKAIVISCGLGTKGKAVGAAKAYLGLGAGVFSSLFHAAWPLNTNDPDSHRSALDFLAMAAIFAILAIVLPSIFALPSKDAVEQDGTKDDSTSQHYSVIYAGLGFLCVVVVGSSAASLFETSSAITADTSDAPSTSIAIPEWVHSLVILLAWIGPILSLLIVPSKSSQRKQFRKSQSAIRRQVRQAMERQNPHEKMRLLAPPNTQTSAATSEGKDIEKSSSIKEENEEEEKNEIDEEDLICETPTPVLDRTLPEMLRTVPAWLFLGAATILVGSGTMLTINMGQMVQSLGFPSHTASACLAIFSVAQAIARVAAGAISETALQWKTKVFGIRGVPRTAFLVLSCAFAVAGHAVLAVASDDLALFVVGITLTGFSFGALWPLMVLIVGDLFGTVNHGANYMFADGFTCAVGTLSIAKFLTQMVYEQHVVMDGNDNDSSPLEATACFGEECFQSTHTIISGLCFLALIAATVLLYGSRSSYGTILS